MTFSKPQFAEKKQNWMQSNHAQRYQGNWIFCKCQLVAASIRFMNRPQLKRIMVPQRLLAQKNKCNKTALFFLCEMHICIV